MDDTKKTERKPEVRFTVSPENYKRITHQAKRADVSIGILARIALMEKINILEAYEAQNAGPLMTGMIQSLLEKEKDPKPDLE